MSGAGGVLGGVVTPPPPLTPPGASCCRYITQEGNKLETSKSRVPTTVTNAVSWRSEGIKYKKNEVFIDVIESVNLLVRLGHGDLQTGRGGVLGSCHGRGCSWVPGGVGEE